MLSHDRFIPNAVDAFVRTGLSETAKGNPILESALHDSVAILGQDPYNRSARHPIKKLKDIPSGGQWRIHWRDYRLRYDIYGTDVVLHSFRHRKEAY